MSTRFVRSTDASTVLVRVARLTVDLQAELHELEIGRDELAAADTTGEIPILLGAMKRLNEKLKASCVATGTALPTAGEAAALPDLIAGQPVVEADRGELSPEALVALAMVNSGSGRSAAEAYLQTGLGIADPSRVLDEVYAHTA